MPRVKVYFELTFICNLKCKFCYAGDMQKPANHKNHYLNSGDLSKVKPHIDTIFCDGDDIVYDIDILGGESLINKHFFEIIAYISETFTIGRFTLTTNASLLSEEIVQKIQKSPINELRISLHGNEETHNSLVGKEVFQTVIHSLELLRKYKIEYTLIYVYNNINRNQIIPLLYFLEERNILPDGVFIEFVEFSGFAHEHIEELNIVYDDELREEFDGVLRELRTILDIDISLSNFPKCMLSKDFHHYIDDNYSSFHRYELYYPHLTRKSLFGFSYDEQRKLIKSNLEKGYKVNFQKRLESEFIPEVCNTCVFNKNCYLLTKESILYDYLGYDFLKRKSYFEINKKNIPGSLSKIN